MDVIFDPNNFTSLLKKINKLIKRLGTFNTNETVCPENILLHLGRFQPTQRLAFQYQRFGVEYYKVLNRALSSYLTS